MFLSSWNRILNSHHSTQEIGLAINFSYYRPNPEQANLFPQNEKNILAFPFIFTGQKQERYLKTSSFLDSGKLGIFQYFLALWIPFLYSYNCLHSLLIQKSTNQGFFLQIGKDHRIIYGNSHLRVSRIDAGQHNFLLKDLFN